MTWTEFLPSDDTYPDHPGDDGRRGLLSESYYSKEDKGTEAIAPLALDNHWQTGILCNRDMRAEANEIRTNPQSDSECSIY